MEPNGKKELWRAVKFTLFSISAGLIEIVSFTLLTELSGWSYWPCYLIALVLSVLWNFTLNRKFTFKSAANVPVAMLKVDQHGAELRHRIPLPALRGLRQERGHRGEVVFSVQRKGEKRMCREHIRFCIIPQARRALA